VRFGLGKEIREGMGDGWDGVEDGWLGEGTGGESKSSPPWKRNSLRAYAGHSTSTFMAVLVLVGGCCV